MRVLFTTQPAHGHFRPLLPLAATLRGRGHDVRFASSSMFTPAIETEGYRALPAGLSWLEGVSASIPEQLRAPDDATLAVFFAHQFVTMTATRLATDVINLARSWRPDVVINETTEFGGVLAAEILAVPRISVQVASPSLITAEVLDAVGPAWDGARRDLGLAPDASLNRLHDHPLLCFAPPRLHDPEVPLPPSLVHFGPPPNSAGDVPPAIEGLGRRQPLVYATLGTVFNDPAYELPFFPAVLDGLRDEGVDLLVSVGPNVDPGTLGSQPSHVHVASYVPQRSILPRCSVAVCHGGYGTLLDSIEAGVPIVVVPFGADQHINGASVERLRLGRTIQEKALTPERVCAAVRELLGDPGWGLRVRALREEWRSLPGVEQAALVVEAAGRRAVQ